MAQVVLIIGQADIIVPENLSAAANYNCVRCLTYALASQLVLTLDGPLSIDGMARLSRLWEEIADFGRALQGVPLSEIQARLEAYKQQIMDIIRTDPSASPATGTGTDPTGGSGQTQPPSEAATPDPAPAPAGPEPVEPAPATTSLPTPPASRICSSASSPRCWDL